MTTQTTSNTPNTPDAPRPSASATLTRAPAANPIAGMASQPAEAVRYTPDDLRPGLLGVQEDALPKRVAELREFGASLGLRPTDAGDLLEAMRRSEAEIQIMSEEALRLHQMRTTDALRELHGAELDTKLKRAGEMLKKSPEGRAALARGAFESASAIGRLIVHAERIARTKS